MDVWAPCTWQETEVEEEGFSVSKEGGSEEQAHEGEPYPALRDRLLLQLAQAALLSEGMGAGEHCTPPPPSSSSSSSSSAPARRRKRKEASLHPPKARCKGPALDPDNKEEDFPSSSWEVALHASSSPFPFPSPAGEECSPRRFRWSSRNHEVPMEASFPPSRPSSRPSLTSDPRAHTHTHTHMQIFEAVVRELEPRLVTPKNIMAGMLKTDPSLRFVIQRSNVKVSPSPVLAGSARAMAAASLPLTGDHILTIPSSCCLDTISQPSPSLRVTCKNGDNPRNGVESQC